MNSKLIFKQKDNQKVFNYKLKETIPVKHFANPL